MIDVERRRANAEPEFFDVEVVPLIDKGATLLGTSISFTDVSGYNRVNRELERSKHALETASAEPWCACSSKGQRVSIRLRYGATIS